jgi:hypothetical protein
MREMGGGRDDLYNLWFSCPRALPYGDLSVMSFTATTYRVLIASPSDLTEEREAATMAINDWNAQHAAAEGIVLLPVKWESHARPESGLRPQGAINAQIVQTCDMLIGMFWTKLGTDTGVAESGTVEEISQFVEQQKPALLYFSNRPIDPGKIDLKQHRKLKAFKDETHRQALVGSFNSVNELRTKLLRDLTGQVRTLSPGRKRSRRTEQLDEAQKITELMRLHKQNDITPEQFEKFRVLLGLKPQAGKSRGDGGNPVVGLFFDYGATVTASINRDRPDEGWMCTVDIAGDNYETKKFEVLGIVLNSSFDTAEAAIRHGKDLVEGFGVECVDERTEEL